MNDFSKINTVVGQSLAFFRNNQQLDTLVVTGSYDSGTRTETAIKLPNNTVLNLDLAGLSVKPSNKLLSNPEQVATLKIVIEWGDGKSDTIAPFFQVKRSSINTKFDPWSKISHTYSLKTQTSSINLKIFVYNSLNDCLIITVPITIQFQSLLDSGAKLNLVTANVTNDNKVSYVINNSVEKSNFVVGTVN